MGGYLLWGALAAAAPSSAAEIAHRLERLRTPVRVLYVAAHPDDENTQLLTWLARGLQVRAAYLSLTRGDGGQNLIGPEQGALLGLIRTQELLAARRLDGAEQWFTRLRDFGYSKSAEESLRIWGEERALAQVVAVFREFRPHVVITRFPETGDTHGHHLASARLARQAFAAAAEPDRFPEQMAGGLRPWRVRRLLYNYPHFWASKGAEAPRESRYDVDVGGYDPWLGRSFGEISADSRSMHKSQGFGASARTGPWRETLIFLEGEPPTGGDPFEGLETWAQVPGGAELGAAIEDARSAHRGGRPGAILPWLGRAHKAAGSIEDEALRAEVRRALEELLVDAAGLLLEARSEVAEVEAGEARDVEVRVLVRAPEVDVVLRRISGPGLDLVPRQVLETHELWTTKARIRAPAEAQPTRPHWLAAAPEDGSYVVEDPQLALRPVGPPPLSVRFELGVGGLGVTVVRPIERHWVDPVLGERTEPLEIAPPVSVTPEVDVVLLPRGRAVPVVVDVVAGPEKWSGSVSLGAAAEAPPEPGTDGGVAALARLEVVPPVVALALEPGESRRLRFELRSEARATVAAAFATKGRALAPAWSRRVVDHPHVPRMVVRAPARVELVPVELAVPSGVIGYVPGSGDEVGAILARAGLDVRTLDGPSLRSGDLSPYRAILLGIRAYNVNADLRAAHERLMAWVQAGGTLVVQYNTKNWASNLAGPIGPFPIEIARDRVTDESAEVRVLAKEHPLLVGPNPIRPEDFAGWVQERGLYFAERWDARYTPLFSMNDPGEKPLEGSTLVARHGAGTYVFTGLSFFRQLPAGHPGALRLLVNFLAAGSSEARR